MVWFWKSDAEGGEGDFYMDLMTPVEQVQVMEHDASLFKRKSPYLDLGAPLSKRVKVEEAYVTTPPDTPSPGHDESFEFSVPPALSSTSIDATTARDEAALDTIQYHFGLEILLKHDELRLINQELAKCQIALEQLRRCHLIPYPTTCPTPAQMLEISAGTGAAPEVDGQETPSPWAPPFGVIDGPYARHYAKWLIPDKSFGDIVPQALHYGAVKSTVEGRSTRTQAAGAATVGKRSARVGAGQKLHALSPGYPHPKDKAGPCMLKNATGEMVKLVCIDCHRENFSSTQGFINHCRIAHRRDLKSHEEAARQCGQSLMGGDQAGAHSQPTLDVSRPSGLVHAFAQYGPFDKREACISLLARIQHARNSYHQGHLAGATSVLGAVSQDMSSSQAFIPSSDTPYLSQLMQKRHLSGDVRGQVADAKAHEESPMDDGQDLDDSQAPPDTTLDTPRLASGMRMPATAPRHETPVPRPALPLSITPLARPAPENVSPQLDSFEDEDMLTVNMSPHAMSSHHAPSLVSDDGEYEDDDDDDTASTSEGGDVRSASDSADVRIEEDHEIDSRALGHRNSASSAGGQCKADGDKHVTYFNDGVGANSNNHRTLQPKQ